MGLKIWLWQRITAIYLLAYGMWLTQKVAALAAHDYTHWKALWSSELVAAATLSAFLSLGLHATLGLWFIGSDYLKSAFLRWLVISSYVIVFAIIFIKFALVLGGLR